MGARMSSLRKSKKSPQPVADRGTPEEVLCCIAQHLIPRNTRQAPPPTSAQPEVRGAYSTACGAQWADLAAMRLTCREWARGATLAVDQLPAWIPPWELVTPLGRWAKQAPYIQTINVVIPHEGLLPQDVDPNALQAQLEAEMHDCYPRLQKINWQVDEVLRLVNEKMSWVLSRTGPRWDYRTGPSSCEFVDVPGMVMDSVICPERQVTIVSHCKGNRMPWVVELPGPVTVKELVEAVSASGQLPADQKQKRTLAQLLEKRGLSRALIEQALSKATRWDTVPECRYFQDLSAVGGRPGVYSLSVGY